MKKQALGTEELASLCRKAYGTSTQGDYAIITLPAGRRPEEGIINLYANPFLTKRLLSDGKIRDGFTFELDAEDGRQALLNTPEDLHDLLALVCDKRISISRVYRKTGSLTAAVEGANVIIKNSEDRPNPKDVQNAFKPAKIEATYVRITGNKATIRKTLEETSPKIDDDAGMQRRLMTRFRKMEREKRQ